MEGRRQNKKDNFRIWSLNFIKRTKLITEDSISMRAKLVLQLLTEVYAGLQLQFQSGHQMCFNSHHFRYYDHYYHTISQSNLSFPPFATHHPSQLTIKLSKTPAQNSKPRVTVPIPKKHTDFDKIGNHRRQRFIWTNRTKATIIKVDSLHSEAINVPKYPVPLPGISQR